jgi:TolB protein
MRQVAIAIALGALAVTNSCGGQGGMVTPAVTATTPAMSPSVVPYQSPTAVPTKAAGRIVFVTGKADGEENGHIWVINADGSDAREIVGTGRSEGPGWVPGGRIMFDGAADGFIHVFSVAVDGTDLRQITSGERFVGFPSVSPDGQTVAVDYDPITSAGGIFLMGIDGSDLRRLVQAPLVGEIDSAPAFSPDGRRVAFLHKRDREHSYDESAIYVVNLDGSGLQQVTSDWDLNPGPPRWTPDGRSIAFSDHAETGNANTAVNVWLVNADGGNLRQLTHNDPGSFDFSPDFSPDGTRMVVVRYRADAGRRNSLWTMNLDGTNATEIFTGTVSWYVEWPRWGELLPNV